MNNQPNILFIMADDHSAKAISSYNGGINKTPNIDRIAKEGMKFNHCYVILKRLRALPDLKIFLTSSAESLTPLLVI